MRTRISMLVVSLVAPLLASSVGADTAARRLAGEIQSPPGQLVVVTANARQAKVLDVPRFKRLLALVEAIRTRPLAFNAGNRNAVTAPDVILLQEMTVANVEIFRRLFNQRSDYTYEIVFTSDSNREFLINSQTVTLQGEPVAWDSICRSPDDPRGPSRFLKGDFTENETGLPFTIAAVHFPRTNPPGESGCKDRNTAELRNRLADEALPIIVGGDFNIRPVEQWRECDPKEESPSLPWYDLMTAPTDGGHVYVDSVRDWHRTHGVTMEQEWTHEWRKTKPLCHGQVGFQRSRIDYLFAAGTQVAAAHADHPGWAGDEPGVRAEDAPPYSDHRFVYGRFVIGSAPRASRPSLEPSVGSVSVTWSPAEGAVGYVLYRGTRGHPYRVLDRLDAATTSFRDGSARHETDYRYAVAVIGADGSQSAESRPARITIDRRGPRVITSVPRPGATGVARGTEPQVRFDENVAAGSVNARTMELWRNGRRVPGRTVRSAPRVLTFDPRKRLAKRTGYRVVVKPISDPLGNRGERYSWRFSTGR
jgi:exonuclease III